VHIGHVNFTNDDDDDDDEVLTFSSSSSPEEEKPTLILDDRTLDRGKIMGGFAKRDLVSFVVNTTAALPDSDDDDDDVVAMWEALVLSFSASDFELFFLFFLFSLFFVQKSPPRKTKI
jgi:hypothetical protein